MSTRQGPRQGEPPSARTLRAVVQGTGNAMHAAVHRAADADRAGGCNHAERVVLACAAAATSVSRRCLASSSIWTRARSISALFLASRSAASDLLTWQECKAGGVGHVLGACSFAAERSGTLHFRQLHRTFACQRG